jgi:hypothetical protein
MARVRSQDAAPEHHPARVGELAGEQQVLIAEPPRERKHAQERGQLHARFHPRYRQ